MAATLGIGYEIVTIGPDGLVNSHWGSSGWAADWPALSLRSAEQVVQDTFGHSLAESQHFVLQPIKVDGKIQPVFVK